MIQELQGVGGEAGLAHCHGDQRFTQVTHPVTASVLATAYCPGCPIFTECQLLAVRTLEEFGSLFGVWAGQVFNLDRPVTK